MCLLLLLFLCLLWPEPRELHEPDEDDVVEDNIAYHQNETYNICQEDAKINEDEKNQIENDNSGSIFKKRRNIQNHHIVEFIEEKEIKPKKKINHEGLKMFIQDELKKINDKK